LVGDRYPPPLIILECKFDAQLLIEEKNLSEDKITEYITKNIEGDCLLAIGDEELIKNQFHRKSYHRF
jgi:hypothetical protein